MATEGNYLPTDVDWNNKDVLHRNYVHGLIDDVACVVEPDLQAAISLQTVLGIRFPLVLVHYDSSANHQTHFLTALAWTMVTHHEFVQLSPTRTRASTTYTIASTRAWMIFFPIIRRLLKVNYRRLMSEDVPMRERRGELRSWGYTFRGDGSQRDIRSSLSVGANNVMPPPADVPPDPIELPLSRFDEERCISIGRSDHNGLKLVREGQELVVFPRLCTHEGADLSRVEPHDGCLACPWHGRKVEALARLPLDDSNCDVVTSQHSMSLREGLLTIRVHGDTPDEEAPQGDRWP